LLDLRVEVDLEMLGGVDLPLEPVVVDVVLPEVRDDRGLGGGDTGGPGDERRDEEPGSKLRQVHAQAHKWYLGKSENRSKKPVRSYRDARVPANRDPCSLARSLSSSVLFSALTRPFWATLTCEPTRRLDSQAWPCSLHRCAARRSLGA